MSFHAPQPLQPIPILPSQAITHLQVRWLFIDKDANWFDMSINEMVLDTPGMVSKTQLVQQIARGKQVYETKHMDVLGILTFLVECDHVMSYFKNELFPTTYQSLSSLSSLPNPLPCTPTLFQDMNELVIVFYEKDIYDLRHVKPRACTLRQQHRHHLMKQVQNQLQATKSRRQIPSP